VGESAGTVSAAGLGVACTRQDVPSQRSAKVMVTPEVLRSLPTAVHALAAEQATDLSCPPGTVALGELWMLQLGCAAVAAGVAEAAVAGAATMNAAMVQPAKIAAKPPPTFIRLDSRMPSPQQLLAGLGLAKRTTGESVAPERTAFYGFVLPQG
jgi:hypothetical protein